MYYYIVLVHQARTSMISIPSILKSGILLWARPPVSVAGSTIWNVKVECQDMWHPQSERKVPSATLHH